MASTRSYMLAVLGLGLGASFSIERAAAQSRTENAPSVGVGIAGPDGYSRTFSTGSGVGVAVGQDGSVDLSLPQAASPFAKQRTAPPAQQPLVDTGPNGVRVFVDPPPQAPQQPVQPPLPADVQGLLDQFAPGVRVGDHGVQVETGGVRVDTRGGVTVDLDTPNGAIRVSERAVRDFTTARNLFSDKDYERALRHMDAAVREMPRQPKFHQFRSLVLFALGDYAAAADDAYQALALGPAWDWQTLRGFYASADEYTAHYRRLQRAAQENPSAERHFLLAYHYAVIGHHDAALTQLKQADRLLSGDRLIHDLISQLEERPAPRRSTTDRLQADSRTHDSRPPAPARCGRPFAIPERLKGCCRS